MALIQLGTRVLSKFLKGSVPLNFTDNKIINFINLQDTGFTSPQLAKKLKVSTNDVDALKRILKKNRYRLNREINAGNIKLKDGTIFSKTYSPVGKTGIEVQSFNKLLIKQRQVDEAAAKFNPNNPKTWKGLIDGHGKATDKTLQFVLPKDRTVRNFVVDKLKEINKKRPNVVTGNFDPELTQAGFLKTFGKENMTTEVLKNFSVAVNNLGKRYSTLTSQQEAKVLAALNNKNDRKIINVLRERMEKLGYTPGQKSFKQLLNDRKRSFNKATGVEYPNPAALEFEHANAMVNALRMRGYRSPTQLANVPDDVLIEVHKDVGMLNNLGFAKASINRKSALSKANLYERQSSPKNIETRALKVEELRNVGKYDEADILEQKIIDDIDAFEKVAAQDAADGFPLKYDFTDKVMYGHLPDYAMRKNPYPVPESGAQQLFDIIKGQGLEPFFEPKTTKQFLKLKGGGRVEYGQGTGPAGVQPIAYPKTDFDTVVRQMQDTTGLGLGDAVLEVMKDRAMAVPLKDRNNYSGGGSVTKGGQFGLDVTNKVGAVESLLAGIASGLIDIPKGAFTLGASLLDLGFGTNNAAKVSAFFDDLTTFDEKAKDHFLGEFAKVAVNLGVPGYYGFKAGEKLARTALLAKRNGNYFKLTDPALVEKFNTSLNAGGRLMATLGGAAGAGVTDAIFVGDPEGVGTFGDMVGGGPTELDPNDEKIASREILNRMKFGVDGSLFLGLVGGAGSSIKSLYRRRNDLASNNDAIDKFLGAFRPRGQKSQEYFDLERRNIGVRATDINFASQEARKLDKHIDAIFPFVKNPFNQMGNEGRSKFMDKLNETLLSGESTMNAIGKVEFGPMDRALKEEVESIMRSRGAAKADIEGVFDSFEAIRGRWGRMFSRLGTTMDDEVRDGFAPLFSKKFKDYLGSTYEMFQNKSLIPLFRYKPTQQSLDKVIKIFQDSAKDAGKPITKEQAEFYANQVVETAKLPRDLATASERTSGIYFDAPDFFVNRTTLSELEGRGTVALEDVINSDKKAFEELFGKVKDPMQTMLTGTNRLSLIARRNQFFNELLGSDKKMAAERAKFLEENPGGVTPATMRGFFRETEREAVEAFGQNIKKIDIDPSRTIEAGITNPLHGKYAEKGVAEAIEESSMLARDKSTLQQLYDSFVLYPKATSQMAKTILSPVTHIRNFVSAGAFASSNGLFLQAPDEIAAAMKDAYKALQIPGSRMANDEYRKLLSLGVVNSNVRLGDLQKLLKDTNFGETINSTKAMRNLMRPLSKLKKWTEDMYTAEDDFWKITSYALERRQLANAYKKYGINKTIDELDEEAADLIRNQIPNYDMVNDFIRATRKLPLGNFVSFPAEIMRTTANILNRAIKEINMTHTLDDGRIVKPLQGIGYKRLFGLGTTVVAIPYGTVEAAKAIYGVTEDEMQAMRRFVPDWSKNSTLVPIRGEDGNLKYIDFSHANAYDTMIRPITAMYTGIQRGMDENAIGREVLRGMWEGTKETLSPFVSESIWTSAISDIFIRGGRTREGNRLWTDETPWGEMMSKAIMHAAQTQFPGSYQTFKRLDLAIEPVDILTKGKFDKYGQSFELGDELLGFAGMRAVEVNPLRAMDFKIADFRTGINNARREFTGPTLRGPVDPATIVDRYKVASEALYKVQEKMHRDYLAARTLGTPVTTLDLKFADRISDVQLQAIKRGVFKPFIPSENIEKAFADNARAVGQPDPYQRVKTLINRLIKLYDGMPLGLELPDSNNPFRQSIIGQIPIGQSPIFQGLTNSPASPGSITFGQPVQQQLQQTAMKGQQVFGANDSIFGVG